jgi:hypothetical protein
MATLEHLHGGLDTLRAGIAITQLLRSNVRVQVWLMEPSCFAAVIANGYAPSTEMHFRLFKYCGINPCRSLVAAEVLDTMQET